MLTELGAKAGQTFDRLGDALNRIPTYQRRTYLDPDHVWEQHPSGGWLWPQESIRWTKKREWRRHGRYFGYHPVNWYFVARRFDRFRRL